MKTIHEVLEFEHKGIKVCVKINHLKHNVALVDLKGDRYENVENKKWVFADRGLEYMKSWQYILDAMKYAISEATKILEKDSDENSRLLADNIIQIQQWESFDISKKKKK
jgi:hypothetical protein